MRLFTNLNCHNCSQIANVKWLLKFVLVALVPFVNNQVIGKEKVVGQEHDSGEEGAISAPLAIEMKALRAGGQQGDSVDDVY